MKAATDRTTKLLLARGTGSGCERKSLLTFGCPMFRDPKDDPAVVAELADGWRITGHVDGVGKGES